MSIIRPIGTEKIDLARILSSIKPAAGRAPIAVCYYRVSTEKQAEKGNSLPEQREACRWVAREIGRHLGTNLEIAEYEDHISGDHLDRPAVEGFRAFVRQHRPMFFLCLDPDRFSRKLMNQLIVADDIEKIAQLVFLSHDKQDTAEGKLFFTMRGAIAEFEKAKILERTQRGVIGKLKAGRLPYNFRRYGWLFNKETDLPEVQADEAAWSLQMYTWAHFDSLSDQEIADRLNGMGVATKRGGAKWYRSTVMGILTSPAYKGDLVCHKYDWTGTTVMAQLPKEKRSRPITAKIRPESEWIMVPIPRIVSDELWEAVQLRYRKGRHSNKGKYLLSGMCYCGLCGSPAHYIGGHSGGFNLRCGMRYPRYEETARSLPAPCSLGYTRWTIVERAVMESIATWLTNPEKLREFMEQQPAAEANMADKLEEELGLVASQIAEKRRHQAEILSLMSRRLLDKTVAEEQLASSMAQLDELTNSETTLRRRLAALKTESNPKHAEDRLSAAAESLGRNAEMIKSGLEALTSDEKREIVSLLVGKVVIYPKTHPGGRIAVFPNTDPVHVVR